MSRSIRFLASDYTDGALNTGPVTGFVFDGPNTTGENGVTYRLVNADNVSPEYTPAAPLAGWLIEDDFNELALNDTVAALTDYESYFQFGDARISGDGNGNLYARRISGATQGATERVRHTTLVGLEQRVEIDGVRTAGSSSVIHGLHLRQGLLNDERYSVQWQSSTNLVTVAKRLAGVGTTLGDTIAANPGSTFTLAAEVTTVGGNAEIEVFLDGVSIGVRTDTVDPLQHQHTGFIMQNAGDGVLATQASLVTAFRARVL